MKKLLVLILTITYFASTSGATVYMHFCMGKMVEWNMAGQEKEKCPRCGMDKSNKAKDCCNDEYKQYKVTADQNITESVFHSMQVVALTSSFIEIPATAFSSITEENPTGNAPPRSCSIPIYKRNCVFLI